jgi:hypothetical protein
VDCVNKPAFAQDRALLVTQENSYRCLGDGFSPGVDHLPNQGQRHLIGGLDATAGQRGSDQEKGDQENQSDQTHSVPGAHEKGLLLLK